MISVITSVYQKEVFENFKQNLHDTIGIPYELIAIDNSHGKMGLCEVYNKAAQRARFDMLCFAHEDIRLLTPQWGQKVIESFHQHTRLGLLGVAGSSYKPVVPSGWSFPYSSSSTMYTNYIQTIVGPTKKSYPGYNNPGNEKTAAVVSVDGMWFCTTRAIATQIGFDEVTFRRFHCYDVDFSLAVFQKYHVAVTYEVQVEHFSGGSFNREWALETLKLHKKWKKHLPVNLAALDVNMQKLQELGAFSFFLQKMIETSLPAYLIIPFVWSQKMLSILGFKTFVKLLLRIVKAQGKILVKKI